jgi:hypothetical protein
MQELLPAGQKLSTKNSKPTKEIIVFFKHIICFFGVGPDFLGCLLVFLKGWAPVPSLGVMTSSAAASRETNSPAQKHLLMRLRSK